MELVEAKDRINRETLKRKLRVYVTQHIDFNGDSNFYLPLKMVWKFIHSAPIADSENSEQGDSLISRKSLEEHLSLYLSRSSLGEITHKIDISLGALAGLLEDEPIVDIWGKNDC